MAEYILAIDQGTTSTKVVLIDSLLNVVAIAGAELPQIYPRPGWVEHDPNTILKITFDSIKNVIQKANIDPHTIAAIGITNQRETTILWDKKTGKPVYNAIVWQCKRTANIVEKLKARGYEKLFKRATGLVLDPYFSATKIMWLLNAIPGLKNKAQKGHIAFGTIDTWLLWHLTNGVNHATDVSNASRTLLFNIKRLQWDKELLKITGISPYIMPEVKPTSSIFGYTKGLGFLPDNIPIGGMVGDQQSALFGQACFEGGSVKATYGTGSFVLCNTSDKLVYSKHGLLTTVAWQIKNRVSYALEGSAMASGSAVQWARDGLGIINNSDEIETLASSVPDSGGVVFVPALSGLGAPWWKPEARGMITGITRGTTKAHIARAILEGIALQTFTLVDTMKQETKQRLNALKVDGGACKDNLLMQFQADILNIPVVRPKNIETTSLGAGMLAGLAVGIWKDLKDLKTVWKEDRVFKPSMPVAQRRGFLTRWEKAIKMLLSV
ncbi:MAG: glycerol kinase GlpK [bacterium]